MKRCKDILVKWNIFFFWDEMERKKKMEVGEEGKKEERFKIYKVYNKVIWKGDLKYKEFIIKFCKEGSMFWYFFIIF